MMATSLYQTKHYLMKLDDYDYRNGKRNRNEYKAFFSKLMFNISFCFYALLETKKF